MLRRPNGAHQPPTSCAESDETRVATTSPLHCWPDTTDGKSTLPKDATQAPRYSERGAVGGRLHALVSRAPALDTPSQPKTPHRRVKQLNAHALSANCQLTPGHFSDSLIPRSVRSLYHLTSGRFPMDTNVLTNIFWVVWIVSCGISVVAMTIRLRRRHTSSNR